MEDLIGLRPVEPDDKEFCYETIRVGMGPHAIATFGEWDEAAQRRRFEERWATWPFQIILMDGTPAGLFSVEDLSDHIFLRMICLRPAYHGQGIGSQLIGALIARAESEELPIRLRCLKANPAKQLYDRLEFQVEEEQDVRWVMLRKPAGSAPVT